MFALGPCQVEAGVPLEDTLGNAAGKFEFVPVPAGPVAQTII